MKNLKLLLFLLLVLSGVCLAQNNAAPPNDAKSLAPKGEEPTMVVRCYASNVSLSALPIELDYLQAYGWEDISVRYQPGTQSLMKVTARFYITLESRERAGRAETNILEFNAAAAVVTCG